MFLGEKRALPYVGLVHVYVKLNVWKVKGKDTFSSGLVVIIMVRKFLILFPGLFLENVCVVIFCASDDADSQLTPA